MRLAPLLGGLSLACDLANTFPPGKALRTCVVAVEVGRAAGLPDETLRDAFQLSLLRYLGCTGFAHEESAIYGAGDDNALRGVMAMADVADPLGLVVALARGVAPAAPLGARVRGVARLLGDRDAVAQHARAQCDTSVQLARLVGAGERIEGALRTICERWDGRGAPAALAAEAIDVAMRLHHLADVAEIALHRFSREDAVRVVERRAGGQLDPELARIFVREHARLSAMFDDAQGPGIFERFLESEPAPHAMLDDERVDDVARALGHFVDLKSTTFLGHSTGVAALATAAGAQMGLTKGELRDLGRAALLHDVGRVIVPNGIWERPGRLGLAEWERVRLHAYYTERVLSGTEPLRELAPIASAGHERLDGSGYHRALSNAALPRTARLLAAADAAHAMREDRPHRAALGLPATRDALRATRGLDPSAVDAVLSVLGVGSARRAPAGMSDRELEVLRLVARGKTNAEIGTLLGISARTVQNHVAHVYDKIGVYSRAGAAVWVMENGLTEPGA